MNIEWLGHSCFKLTESTGTTIITDPYEKSIVGIEMKKTNADVVTCSHQHKDHNAIVNVLGAPMVLSECGFGKSKAWIYPRYFLITTIRRAKREGKTAYSNSEWTAWTFAIWAT